MGRLLLVLELLAIPLRLLHRLRHRHHHRHRHRHHQETSHALMVGPVDLVLRLNRRLQRQVWGQ